jgi:tetratricopeptide (TPR) repeat protein
MYCGVCGASVSQPLRSRRERLLFFMTPLFLVLLCVALSYELGVVEPVDTGLLFAGTIVFVFLGAAGLFATAVWLLSIPALPESYWHAGIFAIAQLLACGFLLHNLEPVFLGEVPLNIGPVAYIQARVEIFAVTFLPLAFVGMLGVSARARMIRFPESVVSVWLRFVLKNAVLFLPIVTMLFAGALYFTASDKAKSSVMPGIAYDLNAVSLSLKMVDKALEKHADHAPLHFLKGLAIIEGQPEGYEPSQARAHLEKAVALQPGVPIYLYRLSGAFDLEHRGEEAIKVAASAAALLSEDAFLWQHLGDLNLKYRNYHGAVVAFKQSLKWNPDNAVVLNNLAYTLIETGQDLPQALEMARMSVEKLPNLVFNLDTLAWALHKNGQNSEALEIMNSIFHGRSEVSPEVDFHYAMILYSMDMLASPLQTFDSLLARPEVAADHNLFSQIFEARAGVAEKIGKKEAIDDDNKPVGESVNEE